MNPRMGSEYLRSLLEPERWTARIPDACGWNTSTFQSVQDFTLTTSGDGSASLAVYPVPVTPSGTNNYGNVIGSGTQAGSQGVWTAETTQALPNSTAIFNTFSMVRPVSGVVLVEFIGTTSSDNGQVCAAPLFRGESAAKTFAAQVMNQYSVAGPLRNGLRFIWKPMDEMDFQFVDLSNTTDLPGMQAPGGLGSPSAPPYTSGYTVTGASGAQLTQPCVGIVVHIAGAAASTVVARVRFIANYEGVPETSTLGLFEVTPHECNPSAISQAMNVISSVPWGDVWQGVAGIGGAILEQAAGTQLPNYLGSLVAGGATSLIRGRLGRRGIPPSRYIDLNVD